MNLTSKTPLRITRLLTISLAALLFSLPTTRLTSVITWSINTLLVLLAADFVFTPVIDSATDVTFTRLGAVYPDAVKVVVRYPLSGANATENSVLVLWRPTTAAAEPWMDGPTLHLQPEFDWTNTTKLTKLWPSTEYECTFTRSSHCCSPLYRHRVQTSWRIQTEPSFRTQPPPSASVPSQTRAFQRVLTSVSSCHRVSSLTSLMRHSKITESRALTCSLITYLPSLPSSIHRERLHMLRLRIT